jgi:hypothetical protein
MLSESRKLLRSVASVRTQTEAAIGFENMMDAP